MAKNVVMPALEMAQETGTIVSWIKKEGDVVAKGEAILEIETDKATVEVESLADGILAGVTAVEGDVIPVGQTIAWIVAPGEEPPTESEKVVSGRATSQKSESGRSVVSTGKLGPSAPKASGAAKVSPKARRLAKEHSIDLSTIVGTGPDGVITGGDVLAARNASPMGPTAPKARAPVPSAVARLMAERTTQSWTHAPHFFLTREVDATALNAFRNSVRQDIETRVGVRVTHTDILVALIGRVLAKHPKVNATWDGEGIRINSEVNVCIAIAVADGVVSPVVPHADSAGLADIALRRNDLAERARVGKLRPTDISGGTFTVSNLGMYDITAFTAIIVPPQAGILAIGSIIDRVVPIGGLPAIRPTMNMTLSSDHRVVDGAQAAIFLKDLVAAIQDPVTWLP